MLFVCFVVGALARGNYVTLDLGFSADGATVPSRALIAQMRVGIPEERYGLMLDFNETRIEIDKCLREHSRTFNVAGAGTDVVLFEEEEFMDPELRDYFRMPVVEYCGVPHSMKSLYYDNCLSERCSGIIGLSPLSGVWEIWRAYTLSLESLHLGRRNPFFHSPPSRSSVDAVVADNHVVVDCRRDVAAGLCEFNATIGGIDVVVDFHTHDSYIYVPRQIYALYMSEVSLAEIHGSKKLVFDDNGQPADRRKRNTDDARRQFHAKLAEARDKIADRSTYYRNSLHRFTMSQWLPMVVEIKGSEGDALVLDSDLLIHSPSWANSYAGAERSASEHFFGESSGLQSTVLLKTNPDNPNSNRVSIGNGLLRRYTLHVDRLESRMLIEERVIVEHLTSLELIALTILFTFYVRSVCYSDELLAPLALCVERRCRGCEQLESTTNQHRRASSHSFRESLLFLLVVVVPPIALVRLPVFVPHDWRYASFYIWAWTTLIVNAFCLLANLWYSVSAAHGNRPASGSYCWRSFRIVLSRAACSEQLCLLGVFCLEVILRRESLGTSIGAVIGCIAIANATRHLYQVARFRISIMIARSVFKRSSGTKDYPTQPDDLIWAAFVTLVLLLLNFVATTLLFAYKVFYPVTTFSASLSILFVALSICAGFWIVHQYADAEMRATVIKEEKKTKAVSPEEEE